MKPEDIKEGMKKSTLWRRAFEHKILLSAAIVGVVISFASCASVERVLVMPPHIPGATFVGVEECSQCHESITEGFHNASHFKIIAPGSNVSEMGCESCHGPGSRHVEAGGTAHTIVNPGNSPETCFQCHLSKRAEFSLPYRHPLGENRVGCGDCHDPHEGDAIKGGGTSLQSANDTCFQCHSLQKGPYVFEHEAIREGCTTCHSPHGSVNARLLKSRNANLCLQCHFQQQDTAGRILIGRTNHTSLLSRGACWSAGCHEAVHGSHVNSHLRF